MEQKETTEVKETATDTEGKQNADSVPYSRFKEVNDEKRELKAKLAEYEAKEIERQAKEDQLAEEKAKQNGEYEKLLAQKDQELEILRGMAKEWEKRDQVVADNNAKRLAELEAKYGNDREATKSLIDGVNDPYVLSSKIDTLEKLAGRSTTIKGGSDIPSTKPNSKLEEYKARLEKGDTLTLNEQREYFRLAMNN